MSTIEQLKRIATAGQEVVDVSVQVHPVDRPLRDAILRLCESLNDVWINEAPVAQLTDATKTIAGLRADNVRLQKNLADLLICLENDGSMIHGDQCFCEICEVISAANAAMREEGGA